jgi:hypothetical protein
VVGAHMNKTLSPTLAVMLFGVKVRPPLPTITVISLPAPAAGAPVAGAPVAGAPGVVGATGTPVGATGGTAALVPALTAGWPYATALAVPAPVARARREAATICLKSIFRWWCRGLLVQLT